MSYKEQQSSQRLEIKKCSNQFCFFLTCLSGLSYMVDTLVNNTKITTDVVS